MENKIIKEALDSRPAVLIGSLFRFECKQGSEKHMMMGKITGFSISDHPQLFLNVTNTIFAHETLLGISYNDGKWVACVDVKPELQGTLVGKFERL